MPLNRTFYCVVLIYLAGGKRSLFPALPLHREPATRDAGQKGHTRAIVPLDRTVSIMLSRLTSHEDGFSATNAVPLRHTRVTPQRRG